MNQRLYSDIYWRFHDLDVHPECVYLCWGRASMDIPELV